MDFKEIFENNHTIAVVGMSANETKPSHWVPVYMAENGYKIYPVNPTISEVVGKLCYPSLMDIDDKIDIVNVFRRSEDALDVVRQAVERKKQKGDVKVVWLQEGIINDEAKKLAEDNGILFIQDRCMHKEHSHIYYDTI
jgi:predicted CoA-binding protein